MQEATPSSQTTPPTTNTAPMDPVPTPLPDAPVAQMQRIASIDVLRGFALLGILVINIQSFAMIDAAYSNPTVWGDLQGANYWVWFLSHALGEQKFMTLFSMLFGAGVLLMCDRRVARGHPTAGLHYRRMGVLLVMGLLHAHLLWYGDILYFYAMCGFLVYLFRNLRPGILITIAICLIVIPSGIFFLLESTLPLWDKEAIQGLLSGWSPSVDLINEQKAAYRGGWGDQMDHRAKKALGLQTFMLLLYVIWRTTGLMLIGMALLKLGVLQAKRSTGLYTAMFIVGLGVGLPIILFGIHQNESAHWDGKYSLFLGSQYNYWGSIPVAFAYVGLVMLICKHNLLGFLTRRLAATGQMALTNYLMQTVICTTIFYGHGFGQFCKVQRVGQILIVLGVCVFQLIVSPIWLARFRFGPMEWLWRSISYGQVQSMRRVHS